MFFLIPFLSYSQKDTIAHMYTFGSLANDLGEDISATIDGGLIVVGSTASSGDGNTDVYLLKIDSSCNKEWSWALGGLNNDWGYAVKQTFDKGFIIAASTNSYGNGGYDAMLIKRDSSGNYEWERTYGDNDWDFAYDVIQTFDSGFVFCGETYNNTNGFSDVYVVKTNAVGDTLWTRTVGGALKDKGNAVIETSDSNIVVVGVKNTLSDSLQAYALKFSKEGTLLWDSAYGGVSNEEVKDVIQTQDGLYVLSGYSTAVVSGDKDYYVIKIDTNGFLVWEQFFSGIKDEEANALAEIDNGDLWIVGYTEAHGGGKKDPKIFRITSGGWWANQNSTFGVLEDEVATGIAIGLNGSIYLSGYTNSYGEGLNDLMIIRVDTVVKQQQYTISSTIDIAAIGLSEISSHVSIGRVFPNPANNEINVEVSSSPSQIQIIDLLGTVLIKKQLDNRFSKIDLGTISSGVYILSIENDRGEVSIGKLIILD